MTSNDQQASATVLELLAATEPFTMYTDKMMLYGQFVGTWQIHSTFFASDGTQTYWDGLWQFAWILGGRGIQDVLYVLGAPAHEFGTTLRCYDESREVWHVSFMSPSSGEFVHLIGRQLGADIVQEGAGTDPRRVERWTFTDITPTTFTWHGEVSFDQGTTWSLEQEMHAVRC